MNRLIKSLEATLIERIMTNSMNPAAYALCWTSGNGVPSWKKTASGSEATGEKSEPGTLSEYHAVNSTDAASPAALPSANRMAKTIPGNACLVIIFKVVSSFVAPRE